MRYDDCQVSHIGCNVSGGCVNERTLFFKSTHICPHEIFAFCEVRPHWDLRTKVYWPIALYLFKFIGGCLGVQPFYRGPRSHSASPLVFVPDPFWQSARLPFPILAIHIECVPMFSFLHCISCMRESLLSSSCAPCTAD